MKILQDIEFGRDYKAGYVFFSFKIYSVVSAGIALFTAADRKAGIRVSHCGLIDREGMCIEADETTGIVARSDFNEKYVQDTSKLVFFKKPAGLDPRGILLLEAKAMSHCGKQYAYGGIVGSALFVLLTAGHRWFPSLRRLKNPLNAPSEFYCSELVADGMRDERVVGRKGCLIYHPTNIYPQTLFDDEMIWASWKDSIVEDKIREGRKLANI